MSGPYDYLEYLGYAPTHPPDPNATARPSQRSGPHVHTAAPLLAGMVCSIEHQLQWQANHRPPVAPAAPVAGEAWSHAPLPAGATAPVPTSVTNEFGQLSLEMAAPATPAARPRPAAQPSKSSLRSAASSSTRSKSSRPRSESDDDASRASRKSRSRSVSFQDRDTTDLGTPHDRHRRIDTEINDLLMDLSPLVQDSIRTAASIGRDSGLTVRDFIRPSPDSLNRILDAYTGAHGTDPLLNFMRIKFSQVGPAICEALANDKVVQRNFLRSALQEANAVNAYFDSLP
ncbi:hypothetical protein JCM9279_000868 [Rhodotorula babjevae]